MDNSQIAEIIERVNGDGFAGEDYDAGWHDATVRIAEEIAYYLQDQFVPFERREFMRVCGLN